MARIRVSPRTEHLEKVLEARIRKGIYQKNDRMPTERELSNELGFSRHTVRKAFQALHHRGILNYGKNGYFVADQVEALDWPKASHRKKNYAIFLHMSNFNSKLLAAMENVIRKHKGTPLTFNLESMDLGHGKTDFLNYLHLKVEGIFFLNSAYGSEKKNIDPRLLETLPLPYIFVDEEPFHPSPFYVGMDPQRLAQQVTEIATGSDHESVELFLPWPLLWSESLFLHWTSQFSAQSPKSIPWNVHFIQNHQSKKWSFRKKNLIILSKRLNHLAKMIKSSGESIHLGTEVESAHHFHLPMNALAERSYQALHEDAKNRNAPLYIPPKLQVLESKKNRLIPV